MVKRGAKTSNVGRVAMQKPSRVRGGQLLAISIFWFALNVHWNALLTVVLPSQVLVLAGNTQKVEALSFVLVPGAFVSLLANPFFGWLSDHTRGRWAVWGQRRPYILVGTLINAAGLLWMARASTIMSLALAYMLVQCSSNAAQAPFHALLPDLVPEQQRGLASGIMGVMMIAGGIVGVVVAGLFVNATLPLPLYQQGLWSIYLTLLLILIALMLVTVLLVQEPATRPGQGTTHTEDHVKQSLAASARRRYSPWLRTIGGTLLMTGVLWLGMHLWNQLPCVPLGIPNDVQQVVLELAVTIGMLRLFQFHPRRNPNFAWVLLTRFLVTIGVVTMQNWIQYYLRDTLGVTHPELETARFLGVVALAGLCSAFLAGWLSDRFGRKRLVYCSGGLMVGANLLLLVLETTVRSPSIILPGLVLCGVFFGGGYGAYQSVDWALVADVLPSREAFAKDMGLWNVALSLPQVIAPVIGSTLVMTFAQQGLPLRGYQLVFTIATMCCFLGTVATRFIRGKKPIVSSEEITSDRARRAACDRRESGARPLVAARRPDSVDASLPTR